MTISVGAGREINVRTQLPTSMATIEKPSQLCSHLQLRVCDIGSKNSPWRTAARMTRLIPAIMRLSYLSHLPKSALAPWTTSHFKFPFPASRLLHRSASEVLRGTGLLFREITLRLFEGQEGT